MTMDASSATPSGSPDGYSERMDQALALAALVHQRQQRKGTAIPYLIHPVQVGWILARHGYDEDLVIAALLHDVLEDAPAEDASLQQALAATFPELAESEKAACTLQASLQNLMATRFGSRVLELVASLSERKTDATGAKRPWRDRKLEQLTELRKASDATLALKAADLIHNLRSTLRDLTTHGLDTFQRFNSGVQGQIWYHSEVVQLVRGRLGENHPLTRQYRQELVSILF